MAFKCTICGKKTTSGNSISHSHRASKRKFKPNLQKIKIILKGKPVSTFVCTKCIKSNRITKAG
ncbi:MAG: 50S ribosomal protein L28 [Elusimicrobia bacterium]|nr:50S ribosomal protein L28 [Elusimicrobiota bacterium]